MSVQIEDISQIKKKVSIEVGSDAIGKAISTVFEKVNRNAKIPGFRPGKAPKAIVEANYGSTIHQEAINEAIERSMPEALGSLQVVGYPSIKIVNYEPGVKLSYEATVEIYPEVSLNRYTDFEIKSQSADVTDQEVENNIQQMLRRQAQYIDRPEGHQITKGDLAMVEYQGSIDNQEVPELKQPQGVIAIGDNNGYPGMEENLLGKKLGDEFEYQTKFPEDYQQEKFRGKSAQFKVKINGIKEEKLPELNDEFVKAFGASSAEEFKKSIFEDLGVQKKQEQKNALKVQILQNLHKANPFEIPEAMIQSQLKAIMEDIITEFKRTYQNISNDLMEKYFEKNAESLRTRADFVVRSALLMGAIADKEKIEVQDSDLDERFQEMAKNFDQSVDQVREFYNKKPDVLERLKEQVKEDKIVQFLIDKSKVV